MKNIHVLPTDKPSRLRYNLSNVLVFTKEFCRDYGKQVNRNIYITNDEEIKEGDYYLPFSKSIVKKTTKYGGIEKSKTSMDFSLDYLKKIILTTDQDLIKDGVQAIDDEFLEWFVKNPGCEWVEVGYGVIRLTENDNKGYWISIPNAEFNMSIEEPKQETLEEAALDYSGYEEHRMDFIAGAKWQQERMYSEEEVKEIIKLSCEEGMLIQRTINDKVKIPYWRIKDFTIAMFKQFKKK